MSVTPFAASSAVGLTCGLNITNVGAIAEQVADSYGTGLAAVGLFTMLLLVTHTVAQIPAGRIADRYGALRVAAGAMSIVLVCNVFLTIAAEPALAAVLRAVVGFGTGAGFVAGSAYIRGTGGLALAQGFYGGIGIFASGLAIAVVPQVESIAGWRAPYLVAAAAAAGALILIALAEPDQVCATRVADSRAPRSLWRDPGLYRLATMHGTAQSSLVVGAWISTLFARTLGVDSATAGLVGALALMGGLITRPGAGWLMVRRPDLVRLMLASSLVVGAVGIVLVATARSVPVAAGGAAVLGLAAGIPFAPVFYGAGRSRPDAPGAAVGLVNALGHGFMIVGTPLLGLAFSIPGDGRVGFAIVAGLWLLALVALPRPEDFGGEARLGRPGVAM